VTMKITVLGSGTSTGVPMVGCHCRGCSSVDPRDKRSRASLLLQYDGHTVLIDTSTDLRQQMLREAVPQIDAVLYTHSHADHVNGIDDLRGFNFLHKEIVPCYGSPETLAILQSGFGYIFEELNGSGYRPLMSAHHMPPILDLFGLEIRAIPLMHGKTETLGFRFGNCAYLTDCNAIPPASLPLLGGLEVLIIDGLRWTPHTTHFNIEQAIAATGALQAGRTVLTHLTHDVLHVEESRLPGGYEFAYDGMIFECSAG